MPRTGFRMSAADVVRPGGDGRQIVIAQKRPQVFKRGVVEVIPGNVGNDSVTLASPSLSRGCGSKQHAMSAGFIKREGMG